MQKSEILGMVAAIAILSLALSVHTVFAMEYTSGENLTISVINATNGTIITTAVCNMTITNSSGVQIDGNPMNNSGDGSYFWIISGIETVLTEKYLAKANCSIASNEWTTWAHFSVVDEYPMSKIDYIRDNPTDYQASGFSTHSATDVWEYGDRNLTWTNQSENLTASDVWTYGTRDLTDYNQTDLIVNITQEDYDTIASHVWAYSTRTLTSFGTLVADIWTYAARTLTNWAEIPDMVWNRTERNLTTGQWGTVDFLNGTQKAQLENTTGDVYNTFDNSTMNVILPADAI